MDKENEYKWAIEQLKDRYGPDRVEFLADETAITVLAVITMPFNDGSGHYYNAPLILKCNTALNVIKGKFSMMAPRFSINNLPQKEQALKELCDVLDKKHELYIKRESPERSE